MIGRLPNRSDKTPSHGENKNCISAKTTANRALHFAAFVISPPRKSRISLGKTGIIKPIARMSRVTVTRMKITAALRDFMLSGACTQRCRDGCVNRRWIGFSEDDVRAGAVFAPRINGPRAGRLHCQRVWTTLSTLAICVMSVLPLSKNENVQEHHKWIGFLEDEVGVGAPSRRGSTARGRAISIANALRTTRSTLAILRDDTAFVPLSKNGSTRE